MKSILVLVIALCASFSRAGYDVPMGIDPNHRDGWALGIGFGTANLYKSVSSLDIKTPRLFTWGPTNIALVLNVEDKQIAAINTSTLPIHLLFDFSYSPYKDVVKTYFRLGAGNIMVDDKAVHASSNLFNVQFQLGFEVITIRAPNGAYGTAFAQAMVNATGVGTQNIAMPDVFSGNSVIIGFRTYF